MIQLRPVTLALLAAVTAALIGFVALETVFPVVLKKKVLLDFDVFHLVSTMIAEGNLRAAYAVDTFLPRLTKVPGFNGSEMLWSYPPFFDLVVAPLSLLPAAPSYIVFMVMTLGFYVWVVRALAGPAFHMILVLFLPLTLLIIRSGQNSFLTGGLIGLTCVLALRRSHWSGVPLGLMAIKPHLALGVGIWSLLDRRWGMAVQSFAVIGIFAALATLVFGTGVWAAALGGMAETADALHDGRFPLFRMTSLYAFGLSVGFGHAAALSLHVTGVAAAIAALILLSRANLSPRVLMGAGVFVSALVSPYNYDYDLAMLAAAACLLIDAVMRHGSKTERYTIAAAILIIATYWFFMTIVFGIIVSFGLIVVDEDTPQRVSLSGPVLFASGIILFRVIWRSRNDVQAAQHLKHP
ncbi:glycosyltransferase family 87 protein [Loktanella sp. M215]|uniref:glycosyltransferase family 87 protein n=1 Tax=Loktanella sp. M215 TaxID=2675431 RepID=UPI001F28C187|nr:glycosyltransferase family 87 protein [Loktanella sp. M215]MCF7700252.1 DUF2029 domain-containing protein [Loktanella sp. M215]